jgi:thymidylate kinase
METMNIASKQTLPMKGARVLDRESKAPWMGEMILHLADHLNRTGVAHAFLRGHTQLPKMHPGADVDILVPASEQGAFEEQLAEVCKDLGARVWQRFQAGFLTQYQLHSRTEGGEHHFVSIDLHSAEACFGVPFLQPKDLLPMGQVLGGVTSVQAGTGALANFLGAYLSGGVVEERYGLALKEQLCAAQSGLPKLLERLFGSSMATRLETALRQSDWAGLESCARQARRLLMLRRFVKAPLGSIKGLVSFAFGVRLRPLWKPRGLFLAFLGTDGAGKTTVMEALERKLAPAFRSDVSGTWHLRPMVIPQLDTILHLGKPSYSIADMDRPHRAKPSGALLSNLRVAYYWTDYIVGYALKILPRRRRQSLILFDRYFYDYKVDPLRCRVQRQTRMVNWLCPWVPKPDQVLVVSAELERVRERKQELSREESAFQIAAYEVLALTEPGFSLVHNNGTVDAAVNDCMDAIFGGGLQ